MFKGVGTINGGGAYKFLLSAIDGDLKGSVDTFRIRIWYEDADATEYAVYDNQLGDATTPTKLCPKFLVSQGQLAQAVG